MTNPSNQELTPMKEAQLLPVDADGLDIVEALVSDACAAEGSRNVHEGGEYYADRIIRRAIEQGTLALANPPRGFEQSLTTPPEPVDARELLAFYNHLRDNPPRSCDPTHSDDYKRGLADAHRLICAGLTATLSTTREPALDLHTLEEAAKVADAFEHEENGRAWDKRQAGRDDNFNCARASAASRLAAAIRALKREAPDA